MHNPVCVFHTSIQGEKEDEVLLPGSDPVVNQINLLLYIFCELFLIFIHVHDDITQPL